MTTTTDARLATLAQRFRTVRDRSDALARPLRTEDQVVQTMPDVSPTKWHLAHVTWFFEAFVLGPFAKRHRVFEPRFHYLFNSYYETVGPMHPRPQRGLLSRPTVDEVRAYRAHVDAAVSTLLHDADGLDDAARAEVARRVELGLHHEEQHQELMLMDCKHVLGSNPLRPAYDESSPDRLDGPTDAAGFVGHAGGLVEIGHAGAGFAFDNELPRHRTWLEDFELQDRLVTCGEWLEFIADGGYRRPELWMADGFAWLRSEGIEAPLYWERDGAGGFAEYSLRGGLAPVCEARPVVHVSWYEADAFARWAGCRLPLEAEWEVAARDRDPTTGGLATGWLEPRIADPAERPARQLFGEVWQWTASPYVGYPGFAPLGGSLGEYNGKFMSGQVVLRGGCAITPPGHVRATYRNFFQPHQRWAFAGLRLARS
ncbi:MAG: ergothioneine biosynthesis protein EgtB [Planctomycetes bacterium]|nr:ergothioneine biosynthesis protein EgtB [Planctomycetota bacterium]